MVIHNSAFTSTKIGGTIGGIFRNVESLYPQMKLTDIKCKSAAPKEKPYKLADGGGMFLDVRPNGAKYWRLKYRINGKEEKSI